MNPLRSFILPVLGLKIDTHEYNFLLDDSFFKAINPEIETKAVIDAHVLFDKRPNMYILDIQISGSFKNACDRCLEIIDIPVEGSHQLFIKKGTGEDEADVVYLESFDDTLDISKFLYDYTLISFPLKKVIDCDEMQKPPCNTVMLAKWDEANNQAEIKTGSIWDELNNLNLE